MAIWSLSSRPRTEREHLAALLYERLHPVMAALGMLFLVLVLAQGPAREGSPLQRGLLVATWVLWAAFVVEYVLRLVVAPDTGRHLRKTWWQVAFLVLPVLTLVRLVLVLRMARPARVALAALRGSRSARATVASRAGWLAILTGIVVFAAADLLYEAGGVQPYGDAVHTAALAAITGEPSGAGTGVAEVLDVVLAIYAVVFFAALAGILGAFFLEQRQTPTAATGRDQRSSASAPGDPRTTDTAPPGSSSTIPSGMSS